MPFLISRGIPKRALNIYRVFRKLSFVNQPGFLGRISLENPSFFYFQKGRWLSAPDSRLFSCFGEDGFFSFSHTIIPCLKKGAGGNGGQKWRIQTKQVPSQTEPDRNTVRTQSLPQRLKSLSIQHHHCARDAHFLAMAFCAGVRMGSVCGPDCQNYPKERVI